MDREYVEEDRYHAEPDDGRGDGCSPFVGHDVVMKNNSQWTALEGGMKGEDKNAAAEWTKAGRKQSGRGREENENEKNENVLR